MEEEQVETLTTLPVYLCSKALGINAEVITTSEGGLAINPIVTDNLEVFMAEPVQVSRYEYEMLNHQVNIERFTFISMLLIIILIFITAKRNRKVTN